MKHPVGTKVSFTGYTHSDGKKKYEGEVVGHRSEEEYEKMKLGGTPNAHIVKTGNHTVTVNGASLTKIDEATEDETKKYYEPKAPAEKAVWMQHKIQKYTQAGIPAHQFDGGTKKDASRSADQDAKSDNDPLSVIGMVELPKYMKPLQKAFMGLREEVLDEAFPPKKKKDEEPEEDEDENEVEDQENTDKEDQDDDQEQEDEDDDETNQDQQNVDSGISGSEIKPQLETIALQAAEVFAEIDETSAFDSEIKDALESATEAIGLIASKILNQKSKDKKSDDSKKDDPNASDTTDQQKQPPAGLQKESVIFEAEDVRGNFRITSQKTPAGPMTFVDHKDKQIGAIALGYPTHVALHYDSKSKKSFNQDRISGSAHEAAVQHIIKAHIKHHNLNESENVISEVSKELVGRYLKARDKNKRMLHKGHDEAEDAVWNKGDEDKYKRIGSPFTSSEVAARYKRKLDRRDRGLDLAVKRLSK